MNQANDLDDMIDDLDDSQVVKNHEQMIQSILNSFENKSAEEIGDGVDAILDILAGMSNIFLNFYLKL